jgi:hydroxymethylglutaryl-CoA lyase
VAALVEAGLSEIEVAAFVRPDRVPTMADAEAIVAALPQSRAVQFSALYLNQKGFARAEASGKLSNRGWLYSSPSESFLKANSNTSIDEALQAVPAWSAAFRAAGKKTEALMISTAFGCGYEGAIEPIAVARLVERYIAACSSCGDSLSEICLADTVGVAHPNSIRATLQLLKPFGISLSLHLHNTWGLGLANVYAGLLEGVSIFESSVGGLGGCPFTPGASGNVATEDVAYLCHALGISTGVDLQKLCLAAELAESLVESPLPSHVYKAWKHSGRLLRFVVENGKNRD